MRDLFRKIPFNYTSAGDDQIIAHLFGNEILDTIRVLETLKGTGRSSRLLHRFMGIFLLSAGTPFYSKSWWNILFWDGGCLLNLGMTFSILPNMQNTKRFALYLTPADPHFDSWEPRSMPLQRNRRGFHGGYPLWWAKQHMLWPV